MTKKIGIRELARNTKIPDEYDLIEIEDRKSKELKGLFVSAKWTKWVEEQIEKERQRRIDKIVQFAGAFDGEFSERSAKEIRQMRAEEIAKRGE